VINNVLAIGFNQPDFNWSEITPIEIFHKDYSNEIENDINKAIDSSVDIVAFNVETDLVSASSLIGAFLNVDAASLIGKSSAGNDDKWIKEVAGLRDSLRVSRHNKSDIKELISQTIGEKYFSAISAFDLTAARKTRIILVGPGAIALGFLAIRSNSKLKESLLVANTPQTPALIEAIKYMGCKVILSIEKNNSDLAQLALAVTALKTSEL